MGGNSPLFLPPTSKKTLKSMANGNAVSQPALPALLEATYLAIS